MTRRALTPDGIWVSIDVETTGLDPQIDRIIEIGAVRYRGAVAESAFSVLINPGCPLPPQIAVLTGLSDGDLDSQPGLLEVWPAFLEFVGDDPVIGHNLGFDLAFLEHEARRAGLPAPDLEQGSLDTLALARVLLPGQPGHGLVALVEQLGLQLSGEQAHRAAADAAATGRLLGSMYQRARAYPLRVLAAALGWLAPAAEQMPGLYGFLQAARSAPQLPAPSAAPAMPATRVRPVVARGQLATRLEEVFGPDGLLSSVLEGFESRPQQTEMCLAIACRLRSGGALALEAGTGVGKSLAYLASAVATAEQQNEKVVISTNTITLQDQLVERDLPLLSQALGRAIKFVVLKGRSNYLCRRKWDDFLAAALTADTTERLFGLRLLFWQSITGTGDMAELNLFGDEEGLWPLVSGDDGCWGTGCPHGRECYVTQARQHAEQADLIITNHALVCANLAAGGRLLPEYRHLILDEAHHFEGVATDHLGLSVRRSELMALVAGASGRGMRGARVLAAPGPGGWPTAADVSDLAAVSQRAGAASRQLFDGIAVALRSQQRTAFGPIVDQSSSEVRYRARMEGLPPGTHEQGLATADLLRQLARVLSTVGERAPSDAPAAAEVVLMARTVAGQAAALDALSNAQEPDWVYWLEDGPAGPCLRGVPIDVSPALREQLWQGLHSTVLVSATLSILSSFEHTLGRLGLTPEGGDAPDAVVLHSPFDYRRQALLCVPTDLPAPGAGDADRGFIGAASEFLADLLPAVGGRSLVLFTSHRMLREVHSTIASELAGKGIKLLAQGLDGGRSRLLRALRTEDRVAVLGTSTFWEGVDVKGPQLSCLVIARLPFPRPDEPLVAARQEKLEHDGKSSFAHYSLPQAVLRLKQGFGRLIRSAEDRGAVVILDSRVLRRQYGRTFLDSLPGAARFFGPTPAVLRRISDWLSPEAAGTGAAGSGVRWIHKPPETGGISDNR